MGDAFADNCEDPEAAVLLLNRLQLYVSGGDANHPAAREFFKNLPEFSMHIFESEGWVQLLKEIYPSRLTRTTRYAFSSENLNVEHLNSLAGNLPEGYRAESIDQHLAKQLAEEISEFTEDHMGNFDSPEDFLTRGFGFCILAGEMIVCAASTFVVCEKGIEIQINTRPEHRRKGLATAAAARLILHSLQNGLDPNWDAASPNSASLAEKLGYTPQGTYDLWLVMRSG
jgi:GNAT superfamily N-acetyltransferase